MHRQWLLLRHRGRGDRQVARSNIAVSSSETKAKAGLEEPRLASPSSGYAPAPATGLHLGLEPPDISLAGRRAAETVTARKFGLISECRELPALPELPLVHAVVAVGPRQMPGWTFYMPVEGTGISLDAQGARLAAVFEAVERYCAMAPVSEQELIVRAPYCDVRPFAVASDSLALLSERQYRRRPQLAPLTQDKVIDWRRAYSLTHEREVLVPAAMVHFSHVGKAPNDFVSELASTGVASHISVSRAIIAGVCEVLERDALAIAWHNRLPLTSVDPSGTAVEELLAGIGDDGPEVSLFAIPSDCPFPVILALARHRMRYPHAVVGAACRPDATEAAIKAVYETYQILRRLRSRPSTTTPERIRRFDHHAQLYATERGAELLAKNLPVASAAKPLTSLTRPGSRELSGDLPAVVRALERICLEVIVAELTTSDAADAHIRVVRVVIPGAVDVSMDGRFPRLGSSRLRELPVSLGLRDRPLPESRMNVLPIPLA